MHVDYLAFRMAVVNCREVMGQYDRLKQEQGEEEQLRSLWGQAVEIANNELQGLLGDMTIILEAARMIETTAPTPADRWNLLEEAWAAVQQQIQREQECAREDNELNEIAGAALKVTPTRLTIEELKQVLQGLIDVPTTPRRDIYIDTMRTLGLKIPYPEVVEIASIVRSAQKFGCKADHYFETSRSYMERLLSAINRRIPPG